MCPTQFRQAGARIMPDPYSIGCHPISEQQPLPAALPAAATVCRICLQIQPHFLLSQKVPPPMVMVVREKNLGFFPL